MSVQTKSAGVDPSLQNGLSAVRLETRNDGKPVVIVLTQAKDGFIVSSNGVAVEVVEKPFYQNDIFMVRKKQFMFVQGEGFQLRYSLNGNFFLTLGQTCVGKV